MEAASNDILQALDSMQSVNLVLLDMPAAFDAIDPTILLDILKGRYDIEGPAQQISDSDNIFLMGHKEYVLWECHGGGSLWI